MSNTLRTPEHDAFFLRQTNVSNPSVIHSRPSLTSVAASEDYYSLSNSGSSGRSVESANALHASRQTITRFQTPPSRYRTPSQSQTQLAVQPQHAPVTEEEEQHRKTPLRGEGHRRASIEEAPAAPAAAAACGVVAGSSQPHPQGQLRNGGIRRKPVPSAVMEDTRSTKTASRISPTLAQSSAAQAINRERDAPTPGVDDTPYIHFALDQLTRDEEVRGSRRYPGGPGIEGQYPYDASTAAHWPNALQPQKQHRYEEVPQEEKQDLEQDIGVLPAPRNSDRTSKGYSQVAQPQGPNLFIPVSQAESRQPPLNFIPGILRPLALSAFVLALLAYLICLIIAAAWSRANGGMGLTEYEGFADGKYFVFRYLPTILGMAILMWLFEIVKAIYRIAPFIAMASSASPPSRFAGAKLPLQPRSLLLPYFGHFGARMPTVGTFLLVAWLQSFTIPLLASSFNVHQDSSASWHWIAVQGVIWVVIALYILLLVLSIVLIYGVTRTTTSLKWDPRSLADLIVLLERSNALDGEGETVPQIGYFRTSHRPNDVFHAYGIADKPARSYEVEDGRIREKRYSEPDMDLEAGRQPRQSKEAILRDHHSEEDHATGSPLPWFLQPFFALLWPIVAIVLLLAFLIVSYLPSTAIDNGFDPLVPAAVDTLGFSGTNFLYSFLPALLAMIAFLGWHDIDLAYRRLTPFESLTSSTQFAAKNTTWTGDSTGNTAERTLLTSYTADLPVLTSLSALFNGHYRMAFISAVTLLSAAIPILAGGVFWAQFYIAQQRVRISADMSAYIALSVFVTIYALAYLAIWPSSSLRHSNLPSHLDTFAGIRDCLSQSRLLDDFAFRNPVSKIDLVTRLLSSSTHRQRNNIQHQQQDSHNEKLLPPRSQLYSSQAEAAAGSKISLADSVRGFGRARQQAEQNRDLLPVAADAPVGGGPARYAYGRFGGRDGRECVAIDRVRRI
ncbi:hypothetical protein CB0940_05830 [Cercospora beticola]|uniref:Phosphoribosylaminoimidazole-succinocarboxamide synthase n=1 Tax=Cercospora beticola TaxID=122368 RepID=A0A2G5HXY4_CERBT|nr:hypothetical protein CB0940_05830 [Cercospora beticola]PIA97102.1 hypothetical protein CB0940_05830 [Cercospora beticola]WPA98420.1 hypothetical protein RHO25_003032 [Cercospora beticola]